MDTRSAPTYGTVANEEVVVERKPQTRRGAVAAAVLLVVGMAAVMTAGHLSSQHAEAAVHPNKMKANQALMDGVDEKAMQLLNQTVYGLRWVIVRFNKEKTKMEPVMQGLASDDWELDWKSFTNAIAYADQPYPSPCVGFYNFEHWSDESTMSNQPLVITYAPEDKIISKEIARFGYFLGSLLLATDQDKKMSAFDYVALDDPEMTYQEFCSGPLEMEAKTCMLESQFHNCPFDEAAEGSPCSHDECEGAAFENPDQAKPGTVPIACCNYVMDDFCKQADNLGTHGCHPALLKTLDKLCDEPRPDESPELLVTPGMTQNCEADCVQPCMFFEDEAETWKQCSGCETDGLEHDGKIYQCHSKALGFQLHRCCGIQENCQSGDSSNAEMCDALEYFECSWELHTECAEIETKQTEEKKLNDERVASGKGCCETKPDGSEDWVTAEVDIWGTDCGGLHTPTDSGKEYNFSKDMSCEAVKTAREEAAKAAAEEAEASKEAEENAAEEEAAIEARIRRRRRLV